MLKKENIQNIYPLSPMQEGMFFHALYDKTSPAYFEQLSFRLQGELNISYVETALNELFKRYDILRTVFVRKAGDRLLQVVLKQRDADFRFHDISAMDEEERDGYLADFKVEDRRNVFDLSKDVLMRVTVFRSAPDTFDFVWSHHHILMDGWCMGIIVGEFWEIYHGCRENRPFPLPPVKQYREYLQWLDNRDKEASARYWETLLEDYEVPARIPTKAATSSAGDEFQQHRVVLRLDEDSTLSLMQLAGNNHVTLNIVFQTLWAIILGNTSGLREVVFGAVVSGRPSEIEGVASMVGLFINTIPVCIRWQADTPFHQLLKQTQEDALSAEPHHYYPLAEIQAKSPLKQDLLDHVIAFQNFPLSQRIEKTAEASDGSDSTPGIRISNVESFERTNYDLGILVTPGERLIVCFDFNDTVYDPRLLESISRQFEHLAAQVGRTDDRGICEYSLLPIEDKQLVLHTLNDTAVTYPGQGILHRLFELQAAKTPEMIALVCKGGANVASELLTYRELNERADRLALHLVEKGVTPGSIAAVMLNPSVDMAVALLGILKAGAAYLPIDPEAPQERIHYMLADSNAKISLTHRDLTDIFALNTNVGTLHTVSLQSSDLAYVIYTSGTTGNPKGVAVEHCGIVNFISWRISFYGFTGEDVTLQLLSYAFDGFAANFYPPLLSGGKLVLTAAWKKNDYDYIREVIKEEGVTNTSLVPGMFQLLLDTTDTECLAGMRFVVLVAEKASAHLVETSLEKLPSLQLFNEYGPTETSVGATVNPGLDASNTAIIGNPISNCHTYVLDDGLEPVPVGVTGELCVGGAGVARGYLNNPELTAERFVDLKKERIYCTGDRVRWMPAVPGTGGAYKLEFLGRIDHQVKIRGFRIEPGEIENLLLDHDTVREALVYARTDASGEKFLSAYFIPAVGGLDEAATIVEVLRDYLEQVLPSYMIPAHFIPLEMFPLTSTGKIDRRALPDPLESDFGPSVEFLQPQTEVEKKMAEIWQAVLGRPHVGINENFFTIGGDSIKSIQVSSRMTQAGYHLEMKDILKRPTIAKLAPLVTKLERTPDQDLVSGPVPLTPIQARFFHTDFDRRHHFNQSVMFFSQEGFSEDALRSAFTAIWEHHDALRMTFREENGKIIQINNGTELPLSLQVVDLRGSADAADALTTTADDIQRSINIEAGPLMKPAIIHMDDGDRLLIICHHLVIDGVSWRILFEDIGLLYHRYLEGESPVLPLKSDSFKYWAERLLEYADSSAFLKEKEWWSHLEAHKITPIPRDFEYGSNYRKDLKAVGFSMDKESTRRLLTEVNRAFNTEINDILLTALAHAVFQTFGLTEIVVAQEAHGRENILSDISLHRTVGWFTSLYPILLSLPWGEHLNDIGRRIMEVKEALRRIPRKGVGYGILKYLTSKENKEDVKFQIVPQISFNYLGQFDTDLEHMPFIVAPEWTGYDYSLEGERDFELDISGEVIQDALQITIGFSPLQYKPETIDRFLDHYKTGLLEIIDYCTAIREYRSTPADYTFQGLSIDELDEMKSLIPGDIEDIYTLSPMQEGMLFHALLQPDSSAYFTQISYRLQGEMDVLLMKQSLEELFQRYDILRTVFIHQPFDRPLQVVRKEVTPGFDFQDLIASNEGDPQSREEHVAAFKQDDRRRGFDLSDGPLMRLTLIRTQSDTFDCTWSFHHILMDGWCSGILVREFFDIYTALKEGDPIQLPPVTPFVDYIRWLEEQDKGRAESYWAEYLGGYETTARVPDGGDIQKSESDRYIFEEIEFPLPSEKIRNLSMLASREHVTLNTLIQAAWGVVLSRYNRTRDVVFGAVVSGRPPEIRGVETMIGLFINTIPVRVSYDADTTFRQLLRKHQDEAIQSDPFQHFPLASAQNLTPLKQDLLDHIVVFENYPMVEQLDGMAVLENENRGAPDIKISDTAVFEQTNYDFNLSVLPGRQMAIGFKYNGAVYSESHIHRIFNHLSQVLGQVLENPDAVIDDVMLLSEEERKQVIFDFNDTASPYPDEHTIHEVFNERCRRSGENIAVTAQNTGRTGSIELTYNQVNNKADHLALVLREKGVRPGDIVAIMLERSPEMITGILGIIKAGGAYLPIDPDFPADRVRYILDDSTVEIMVSMEEEAGKINEFCIGRDMEVIYLDRLFKDDNAAAAQLPVPSEHFSSQNLAYVMYTSGSSGKPKGTLIIHQGVVNILHHLQEMYPLNESDAYLLKTNYTFDVSVTELFGWFFGTGRLVILEPGGERDPEVISETVASFEITHINFVPSMLNAFLEAVDDQAKNKLKSLRYLFVAGEDFGSALAQKVKVLGNGVRIENIYGPTEATIYTTWYSLTGSETTKVPIGKPLPNIHTYIIDYAGHVPPVGIPGELCIAGVGLARGYLNNPELTAEKFVENKTKVFGGPGTFFLKKGSRPPEARLYRTGDLVRRLPDGAVEFLGRIDHQVKVRGYRIALGEIEDQLMGHEKVREAVVTVFENDTGTKSLCAYIIPLEPETADSLEPGMWREYLLKFLPAYMIPSYFVLLPDLPRTSTGKVNRRALPVPGETTESSGTYTPPESDMEKMLVEIWEKVLGYSPMGIHDDFFTSGGDSIKAIQFLSQLSKTGYKIEMRQLFDFPTISLLAPNVQTGRRIADQSEVTGPVPLTPIQAEFFEIHPQNNHHYNQSLMLYSKEPLDRDILQRVFVRLSEHHDALRLTFRETDGIISQINSGTDQPVSLEVFDLRGKNNPADLLENHADHIQSSLNLENGPLLKSAVFHMDDGDRLLMIAHHLVIDGVSWRILLEDIAFLYEHYKKSEDNPQLPLKTDSFQLWAKRLVEYAGRESLLEEQNYWKQVLNNAPAPVIKKDFPNGTNNVGDSAACSFQLTRDETRQLLTGIHSAFGTEIDDILLTALGLAVKEKYQSNHLLISMEGHGREIILPDIDINRTVGWFTSLYPVHLDCSYFEPGEDDETLGRQIKEIKEHLRRIPHKGIGFGILKHLTAAEHKQDISFNIKPQIVFNYLGQFDYHVADTSFSMAQETTGGNADESMPNEHELSFNGMVVREQLNMSVIYSENQFRPETVDALLQCFKSKLLDIIAFCSGIGEKELTPSDLTYDDMSLENLDSIEALFD